MKTIIKLSLLILLVIGGGLLLGGKAIAESNQAAANDTSATSTTAVLMPYEEQAESLTAQVKIYLASQQTAKGKQEGKPDLSEDQLNIISGQIKEIAIKAAALKEEVDRFVAIRTVSQQIAGLKLEVDELKLAKEAGQLQEVIPAGNNENTDSAVAVEIAPETSQDQIPQENEDTKAQIVSIKQQIKDLTAEYEIQKAAEEAQNKGQAEDFQEVECKNGVCSANIEVKAADSGNQAENVAPKGFWQSVSDFLKNLFTF